MPKDYEAIKAKLMGEGMSEKEAEGHAARITKARRKAAGKPPPKFHKKGKKKR